MFLKPYCGNSQQEEMCEIPIRTCNIHRPTKIIFGKVTHKMYFSYIQILPLGPSTDSLMGIVCLHAQSSVRTCLDVNGMA